jgi:hypothetical protein
LLNPAAGMMSWWSWRHDHHDVTSWPPRCQKSQFGVITPRCRTNRPDVMLTSQAIWWFSAHSSWCQRATWWFSAHSAATLPSSDNALSGRRDVLRPAERYDNCHWSYSGSSWPYGILALECVAFHLFSRVNQPQVQVLIQLINTDGMDNVWRLPSTNTNSVKRNMFPNMYKSFWIP